MEYVIPNFGQYGYIQPKNYFNWKFTLILIGIAAAIFFLVYYFSTKKVKKANDEKDTDINNMPSFGVIPSA